MCTCFDFYESLNVISTDISRFEARYDRDSKKCTSVAEMEDTIEEKIKPAIKKSEKATAGVEEAQVKKLIEEQLLQQPGLRAEESESGGNHVC